MCAAQLLTVGSNHFGEFDRKADTVALPISVSCYAVIVSSNGVDGLRRAFDSFTSMKRGNGSLFLFKMDVITRWVTHGS